MGYSIDNSTKQINLVRGDTLKLQIQVLINGEVYTPRVGDSLRFAMKRDYSTSKVLVQKEIPVDTCILHLEPNDTKKLYSGIYVYDIQITFENGEFGHIVHFAYDENATRARLKAEAKYHEVLAAAAVSELPQHSATLLTADGRAIMNQCYRHEIVQSEPEVEPEPEVTSGETIE